MTLLDGRSLIETVGKRRFEARVRDLENVDGYAVVAVRDYDDDQEEEEDNEESQSETVCQLAARVFQLVKTRVGEQWAALKEAQHFDLDTLLEKEPFETSMRLAAICRDSGSDRMRVRFCVFVCIFLIQFFKLLRLKSTRQRLLAIEELANAYNSSNCTVQ